MLRQIAEEVARDQTFELAGGAEWAAIEPPISNVTRRRSSTHARSSAPEATPSTPARKSRGGRSPPPAKSAALSSALAGWEQGEPASPADPSRTTSLQKAVHSVKATMDASAAVTRAPLVERALGRV